MKRVSLAILLAACGGDDAAGVLDGAPTTDAVTTDASDDPDAAGECTASATVPLAMISGTEGLAIADDGTVYFSQTGRLGRWVPGAATAEPDWITLTGTTTVWGVAVDAAGLVYVASPPRTANNRNGTIWRIDPAAATPTATELYVSPGTTDRPNGLTIGPDGAAYYSDFSGGHVYRVDAEGMRTGVTATTISQPNGVLFDADGTLLVASYATGVIHRLTLDAAHEESGRTVAGSGAGNPDGLARDELGRYYVSDNGGGDVLRYDASFANPTPVLAGVGAAANLAFGRGALGCHDLYVTSSGALRRIDAGAAGVP